MVENSPKERYFPLALSRFCPEVCHYCSGLGQKSAEVKKDEAEILRQIQIAKRAEYSAVLLPCNFLFQPNYKSTIELIQANGLDVIGQVNSRSLGPHWLELLEKLAEQKIRIQIVIDNYSPSFTKLLVDILGVVDIDSFHLPVTQETRVHKILRNLPLEVLEKLSLQFPYHLEKKDGYLTSDQVYRCLKTIEKAEPHYRIKPLSQVDYFDPRMDQELDYEPDFEPSKNFCYDSGEIKYSVVIPTYNNLAYIKNTVRHLGQQDLSSEEFEVIVVDDGSDDGTKEFFENLEENPFGSLQLKYIYYPRTRSRKMGDNQFRAGIARNLGVKYARGEHLCFLDSDILTPPHFLRQLVEEHKTWDVIQARRDYLIEEVSSEHTNYDEIDSERDTFIPEGGYWSKFFNDPKPWHLQENCWKYVCTYTLSMKTEDFKKVGWFKKNYHYYGFEDTDLGYRMVKNGKQLFLSELRVLHLYHTNEKSEFKNSEMLRHLLLKKTANIFFRNQLDSGIYDHLGSLVSEEGPITFAKLALSRLFAPSPQQVDEKHVRKSFL